MLDYRLLLYYKYVQIPDPQEFAESHLRLCEELGLVGRILVATEGLNGTVSGPVLQTAAYQQALREDRRFTDIAFKEDVVDAPPFDRLRIRVTREIVRFEADAPIHPEVRTGVHISPKAFYEMMSQDDVIVVDGRNRYESELGHFRGALLPDVETFRDFPAWVNAHQEELAGKKILTYCTGGIRCEKLSAYLLDRGFSDVYQLDGGIVQYSQDPAIRGRGFEGRCYVFDERMSIRVNHTEEDVLIAKCEHCGEPTDAHINCAYLDCHRRHLCCRTCHERYAGFCSDTCAREAVERHRVDPRSTLIIEREEYLATSPIRAY